MKAILRTNDFSEDFKIVDAIQNKVDSKNSLSLVEIDGKTLMTGGILVEYNKETIEILSKLSPKHQYNWLRGIICPIIFNNYI